MSKSILDEKRGLIKQLFAFYSSPTVPTIRIAMRGDNNPVIELGKRARVRENSIVDKIDRKGWDITSSPIPIIQGKQIEMGYITHPSGCTLNLKPVVKVQAAGTDGTPIINPDGSHKYIEVNFEGVIGVHSDLDDFNESTEREQGREWVIPFLLGSIAGIVFFAPLFAWLMSMVAGRMA